MNTRRGQSQKRAIRKAQGTSLPFNLLLFLRGLTELSRQTQADTVAGHRFVYLITRDLRSSGSSLSSLQRGSDEMLAQTQLSQEDFEEMTKAGRQSLPTYKHWGILVTFNDDVFQGTVFELSREGRLNTPARSPAADVLRQSSQGVPLWTLRDCWSRTYYDDDEIEAYCKCTAMRRR